MEVVASITDLLDSISDKIAREKEAHEARLELMRLANHLAGVIYREGSDILGIEIFGSIARGEARSYSDFDIIVVTDGWVSKRWHEMVTRDLDDDIYAKLAATRRSIGLSLLGIPESEIEDMTGVSRYKLDIFLFPQNWREQLDTLQFAGHHVDPLFMRNIARDARTFVPNQGFAFPVV